MDRGRVIALAGGIAIGVVATAAFSRIRTPQPAAAPTTAAPAPATALDSAARAAEVVRLQQRLAELERAEAAATPGAGPLDREEITPADLEHGTRTEDAWWAAMPKNPSWDDRRRQELLRRFDKYIGIKLEPSQVECKTRCCRVRLDNEAYEAHSEDVMSSVGLHFDVPDGLAMENRGEDALVTACWQTKPPEKPMPDRGAERDATIARAAAAIRKCGAPPQMILKMQLALDEEGQIAKVRSNKTELGHPAAACAETAILQAADFAPAPMETDVPIAVDLSKPR
jgi:hypothetical protein